MTRASSKRAPLLPGLEFPSGALAGAMWSLILLDHLGRNSFFVDTLLVLLYFALNSAFWWLASWVARLAAVRINPRLASSRERLSLFGVLFISILSLCLLLLLRDYVPAHGLSALAAALAVLGAGFAFAGSLWLATRVRNPRPPGSRWLHAATFFLLLWLLASATSATVAPLADPAPVGAGGAPATPNLRLTLVGADGLDWAVMNELLREGLLPNIGSLIDEGVAAPLETFAAKSPLIWTSIATGVTPAEHGVLDFVAPYLRGTEILLPHSRFDFLGKLAARVLPYRDLRPFSSSNRRARAVWEIATLFGSKVLVVNWWATYPADSVNGVLISDYAFPSEVIDRPELERLEDYGRLATPVDAQRLALRTMRANIGDRSVQVSHDPETPARERNEFFVFRDELALRVFEAFDEPDFDLKLLFLNAVDASSHIYTFDVFGENIDRVRSPRLPEEGVKELREELVVGAYRRFDSVVGRIRERLGKNDVLVIASDHGWKYDGTSHWRRPDGVLLIHGGPVRQGHRLPRASVYDVMPTVCFVLGLPVSDELQGRILWEAFHPSFLAEQSLRTVRSYGRRSDPSISLPTRLDREHLERLRSLGYIE